MFPRLLGKDVKIMYNEKAYPTPRDIIAFTQTFAPLETAMDFDNSGFLAGDIDDEIKTAILALDITKDVVEEAKEKGAQLIISHHPIIFNPVKNVMADTALYSLIRNGLSALCLHTNLDLAADGGVNMCLAKAANVQNPHFVEGECLVMGELSEPVTAERFAYGLKNALNCQGLRVVNKEKTVQKIAMCSGAGGDYVFLAKKLGADLLLTGEIKHHEILFAAENDMSVVDAGHYKTEDIVIAPLAKRLSEKFPTVNFLISERYTDGVSYI